MKQRSTFTYLSLIAAIISMLLWVPNLVLNIDSPWWLVIFFVSPAGVIFGVIARHLWFVLLNLLMFFSFLIVIALGFDITSLFTDL
ncbi:MAG TPA: hypothetical protein VK078_04385 [Pseudogracilibacillus sp.]|nr:hypothetical protein [Pseudogracilibacillus sp.]